MKVAFTDRALSRLHEVRACIAFDDIRPRLVFASGSHLLAAFLVAASLLAAARGHGDALPDDGSLKAPLTYESRDAGEPFAFVGIVVNRSMVDSEGKPLIASDGTPEFYRGSGFLFSDSCTILTAAHVLMGTPDRLLSGILSVRAGALRHGRVEFIVGSGASRRIFSARYEMGGDLYDPTIWAVQANDAVKLRIDGPACAAEFGFALAAVKTFEFLRDNKIDGTPLSKQIILAGFPGDRDPERGITVLRDVTLTDHDGGLFYTDGRTMARHGNSGGPALVEARARGRVYYFCIGMMTDIVPDPEDRSYQIPLLTPLKAAARELGLPEN